jgi:uncharacterized membrane protein YfcA
MASSTIALFLALLIGVSLGVLGSGGSIVTLPILVYVAGVPPKSAIGMSITIVGGTSFLEAYFHWRNGNFVPNAVLLLGITGILGAYLGAIGTHLVSASVLMVLFSVLMLRVGGLMLAGKPPVSVPNAQCRPCRCIPVGFVVGLVTGFLGVGGGFLIVPALVWFAGLDAKKAIGTSLGIVGVNPAAGLVAQLHYSQWDWLLTNEFVACSLVGMGIGVPVARWAPEQALRTVFGVVVIAVALTMGWQVLGHH